MSFWEGTRYVERQYFPFNKVLKPKELTMCHNAEAAAGFGTVLADSVAEIKFKHLKDIVIMNIKPLADRVLVLPAPAEEKIGGIIIPDTAKEKPLHGTIKAVGQGTKDETMILKEGDEVLYGKYSGTELEFEGEKYLMMRQSDVLAVIEK